MDILNHPERANFPITNDERREAWCSTCGKITPIGKTECDYCERWWDENPLPDLPKSDTEK